jgi:hypothetical protein
LLVLLVVGLRKTIKKPSTMNSFAHRQS